MGTINLEKSSYRKGLLLGLTLAEIILLLIFILLLVLSINILKKEEENKELHSQLEQTKEELIILQEKIVALTGSQEKANKFDDLFNELVLVRKTNENQKREIVALKEKTEVLEEIKKAGVDPQEVKKLVEEKKQLERDLLSATGQVKNIRQKLTSLGKGTEMPACWANPNTGKTEYIFDVALTSTGLIIHDNKLPHRVEDKKLLPLKDISYDSNVLPASFLSQTKSIFKWSLDKECRFFVKAFEGFEI